MGISKKRLSHNNEAIAGWIVGGILLIIAATSITGTYFMFQRPDITYIVTETGFALFGVEINWFVIIAVVGIIAIIIVWLLIRARAKTKSPQT